MAEMAVTVAARTLRPCAGVSPASSGNRRMAGWRQLAPAAPAKLRLSSPALRVPRAASPAAVEVDSIAYRKTLDEPPCSTAYTLVSRTGALATLIQFLPRKL